MNLILKIKLQDTLNVQSMLQQSDIPCFCKISGTSFELEFQKPLPDAVGKVEGWSQRLICDRAPGLGGGIYTHFNFAQVTLERVDADLFSIKCLRFFYHSHGWITLIENGEWSPPKLNSQEELDELDAMYPAKKGNRKHQKLMKMLEKIEDENKRD